MHAACLGSKTSPEQLYWVSLVAELRKQLQVRWITLRYITSRSDTACLLMYNHRSDRDHGSR